MDDAKPVVQLPPRKRKRMIDARRIKRTLTQGLVRIIPYLSRVTGHFSRFMSCTEMAQFHREETTYRFRTPDLGAESARFALRAGDPIPYERNAIFRTDVLRDVECFAGNGSIAPFGQNVSIRLQGKEDYLDNLNAPGLYWDDGTIDENALYAFGLRRGHKHYWHFLADYYQPLFLFLERADKNKPLVMLTRDDLAEFQVILFDLMVRRFPFVTHRRVPAHFRLRLKQVLIPYRLTDYQEANVETSLIDFLSTQFASGDRSRRLLFVSRNEARLRRLQNESDVFALIEPLGFETICPGRMSFREQVDAFADAAVVIAVHGAALTNLVYAPRCEAVIELFPSDFLKTTYLRLAERIGAEYRPCIGGAGDRHQSFLIEPANVLEAAREAVASLSR